MKPCTLPSDSEYTRERPASCDHIGRMLARDSAVESLAGYRLMLVRPLRSVEASHQTIARRIYGDLPHVPAGMRYSRPMIAIVRSPELHSEYSARIGASSAQFGSTPLPTMRIAQSPKRRLLAKQNPEGLLGRRTSGRQHPRIRIPAAEVHPRPGERSDLPLIANYLRGCRIPTAAGAFSPAGRPTSPAPSKHTSP